MNKYNIGDIVRWTSQAGGTAAQKQGTIIEVVPPLGCPANRPKGCGIMGRSEESYVVLVPRSPKQAYRRRKPELYWPRSSHLELVQAKGGRTETGEQLLDGYQIRQMMTYAEMGSVE